MSRFGYGAACAIRRVIEKAFRARVPDYYFEDQTAIFVLEFDFEHLTQARYCIRTMYICATPDSLSEGDPQLCLMTNRNLTLGSHQEEAAQYHIV